MKINVKISADIQQYSGSTVMCNKNANTFIFHYIPEFHINLIFQNYELLLIFVSISWNKYQTRMGLS